MRVIGRHLFYNDSSFDGGQPAANADDDQAIAPDKIALLPGQRASFANYSSYGSGLNGIILDIENLLGTPSVGDFTFRMGNTHNPGSWELAPAPMGITVRPGEGAEGSDRITLIWPDGAIVNRWLEVTVHAGPRTGLMEDDVFYFGNAIGESGDNPNHAMVNATDVIATRDHPRGPLDPALITDAYDYNRDRRVTTRRTW